MSPKPVVSTRDARLFMSPQAPHAHATMPPSRPPPAYPVGALGKRLLVDAGEAPASTLHKLATPSTGHEALRGASCDGGPPFADALGGTMRHPLLPASAMSAAAVAASPTPARSPTASLRSVGARQGVSPVASLSATARRISTGQSFAVPQVAAEGQRRAPVLAQRAPPAQKAQEQLPAAQEQRPTAQAAPDRSGTAPLVQEQRSADQQQRSVQQQQQQQQLMPPAPPCSGVLAWEVERKAHPMVTDGEKAYVGACLEELARTIEGAGGLADFARPDCRCRRKLVGPARPGREPAAVLVPCLEAILQQRARTGGDTIFIERGTIMSLGGKKVLKVQLWCDDALMPMSICWDWDVKLEPSGE